MEMSENSELTQIRQPCFILYVTGSSAGLARSHHCENIGNFERLRDYIASAFNPV